MKELESHLYRVGDVDIPPPVEVDSFHLPDRLFRVASEEKNQSTPRLRRKAPGGRDLAEPSESNL